LYFALYKVFINLKALYNNEAITHLFIGQQEKVRYLKPLYSL
jgi:hypothetical protein